MLRFQFLYILLDLRVNNMGYLDTFERLFVGHNFQISSPAPHEEDV